MKPTTQPNSNILIEYIAYHYRNRRSMVLLIGGIIIATPFLAFNWSWLTAIGASAILISVLPCAIMCAFGLCMKGGKDCSKNSATGNTPDDGDGNQ
ncbi:hypothetical protein [Sneathiella aquimaris]|jgi:hypothetical protein|uniref:hypothetical protein n=1 Tax=Sneathiella aquimaris TaxID=2599305 RepID=UPI001CA59DB5|nr:hypothetical protein [Sneathiella aquimaris]